MRVKSNRSTQRIIFLAAAVLCLAALLAGCGGSGMIEPVTNRDVINFREFSLDASSVNLSTWTRGTVFVRGDLENPDDIWVQIAMTVDIDPDDWGGVGVHFPEGWRVTSTTSSLVEIDDPYYSDMVGVMSGGAPEQGGWSWVAIGYPLTQAGGTLGDLHGAVVIDAGFVWEDKPTPDTLDLIVGVGSKDGYVVNPVSVHVEVPLLEDMRPVRVQFLFPRQRQPEEFEATGEITGELVLENNELRVDGYLVLWPRGYHGWSDSQTVWIKDSETGEKIARVGDVVTFTGKEVDSRTTSEKASDYSYPGYPFEGPFWLADTVTVEK